MTVSHVCCRQALGLRRAANLREMSKKGIFSLTKGYRSFMKPPKLIKYKYDRRFNVA